MNVIAYLLFYYLGFNVLSTNISGMNVKSFEIGGRSPMRALWRHYYQSTNGLVFVVDGCDTSMLEFIKEELRRLMAEEALIGLPLLVAVNKMDLPSSMSVDAVTKALDLEHMLGEGKYKRKYRVIGTSATTDLSEMVNGLAWLKAVMNGQAEQQAPEKDIAVKSTSTMVTTHRSMPSAADSSGKSKTTTTTVTKAQQKHIDSLLATPDASMVPAP
jgi:signal recognition particle receptor subunit beta